MTKEEWLRVVDQGIISLGLSTNRISKEITKFRGVITMIYEQQADEIIKIIKAIGKIKTASIDDEDLNYANLLFACLEVSVRILSHSGNEELFEAEKKIVHIIQHDIMPNMIKVEKQTS